MKIIFKFTLKEKNNNNTILYVGAVLYAFTKNITLCIYNVG